MSDPSDGGDSEYNIITCVQCSAEVGKVYVRTSHETAKLQDLISLSTDAVCSYQLGRHEMRVQGTGDLNPLSEERVTRLEEQMVKVENVLVLFNERWHAMESALRQLQQRVDVATTPSAAARHGVGMGPGASPGGASPGGGGGGSVGRGPGGGVGMPMLPGEAGGAEEADRRTEEAAATQLAQRPAGADFEARVRAPRRPCTARRTSGVSARSEAREIAR